jgi:hypothetical protein
MTVTNRPVKKKLFVVYYEKKLLNFCLQARARGFDSGKKKPVMPKKKVFVARNLED